MKFLSSILFFIAVFCSTAFAQQKTDWHQDQQGLLWEISGNGTTKPSYLYGTMHVSNKVAFNLSDTFFLGLKNADKIALESDPSTWMDDFGKMATAGMDAGGFGYSSYGENFYTSAFGITPPAQQTYQYYLANDNSQINQMLYRISGDEDFQENTYLDLFIYQAGRKSGKDIVALEDNVETMKLLNKATEPDKKDKKKKKTYRDYGARPSRDALEDAYRKGNLTLIDSLSQLDLPTEKYHYYFIEKRNMIMADGMDSIMQQQQTLFTGVGAAHLPGELGMIHLLEQKGYTVRPVVFTSTGKNDKAKSKIEKLVVPIKLQKQASKDKVFKVDLPGELYQTILYPGYDQYLYPDVANGSFYSLARVKTHNALFEKDADFVLRSIDSLLFENIPGSIEKKTSIKQNGYKGIDIVNKTRTGNYQRYRIVATPLELFIFKAGGNEKYVLSPEVNKIFNSIVIEYAPKTSYTAQNRLWKIQKTYPQQLHDQYKKATLSHYEVWQAYDPTSKHWQLVQEGVLNDLGYIEEDTFELAEIGRQFAKNAQGELCDYTWSLHQGKYPALLGTVCKDSCTKDLIKIKTIIKGNRYYMAATTDLTNAPLFFDQLQLLQPSYSQPFEESVDTTLLYSVQTILPPPPNVYQELAMQSRQRYRYEEELSFYDSTSIEGQTKYNLVSQDSTQEYISVQVKSFDKYYSDVDSTFWNRQDRLLLEYDQTLHIKSDKKSTNTKGMLIRDLIIADSTSSRVFLVKQIAHHGLYYTLMTMSDTIDGKTPFVEKFYNTFTPKDTQLAPDFFVAQGRLLLQDFQSKDSLTVAQAKEANNNYIQARFDEKDAQLLVDFINTYDFQTKDLSIKAGLIKELGYLNAPFLTQELIALYQNAEGKTSIELACLFALARRKTMADYQALQKLVATGDLPLPFYERDLNSIFYQLDDSLALSKHLFPELYQYLSYPEYKTQIFGLLSEMVEQNIADTTTYAKQRKRIMREGINSLKRQQAKDEEVEEIYFESGYRYGDNSEKTTIKQYYYSWLEAESFANPKSSDADGNLLIFTKLLFPLKEEPMAKKQFFSNLYALKDGTLLYALANMALDQGVAVPDSLWRIFSQEPKTTIPTYIRLKEKGKLSLFDTASLHQQHFAQSMLSMGTNKKDSILFLDKKLVTYQGDEGYIYFFKRKKEQNDYWTLHYAGLMPKDSSDLLPVNGKMLLVNNLIIKKEDKLEELIKEAILDINIKPRKRIRKNNTRGKYDYNY